MKKVNKLKIDSYRGIRNLELNDLTDINIITGDNNCGKTSVLEVINSFSQPDNILMWTSLIRKDLNSSHLSDLSYYEGICDLFDINLDKKLISYSMETQDEILNIKVVANETLEQMTSFDYNRKIGYYIFDEDVEKLKQSIKEVNKLKIDVCYNGENVLTETAYEGQRTLILKGNSINKSPNLRRNIVHISPVRHATGTVFLSEVFDHPDLYEEMLAILKEYDDNIISINYDKDSKSNTGVYKILSKTHQKALPLNVYGDGMKKAILLMSAVIKAQNGILLLDEFETAIHTSAMSKTFKWILETCKKLNVQVFMTTHSEEALDKVLKCSEKLLDNMAVYTMYKENETTVVRRLDARKAIVVKDEMGLELR